jgi:signal transduction histidine kinase
MTDREQTQDLHTRALRESLSEISRTFESLRERVKQLSRPGAPPGSWMAGAVTQVDPASLRGVDDILAIPTSGLEPGQVLEAALERLGPLLAVDRTMLFLLDPVSGRLMPRAGQGFRRGDLGEIAVARGEGLVGRTLADGHTLLYTAPESGGVGDPFVIRFPVASAIAVPVRSEGGPIGVLYAGRRERGRPFRSDEAVLLHLIADRVAVNVNQARLAGVLGGHIQQFRELGEFSSRATIGHDLRVVLTRACDTGARLVGVPMGVLARAQERGELVIVGAAGVPPERLAAWHVTAGEGLTGAVFASGAPVVVPDLREREGGAEGFLDELGIRACLLVPLRIAGTTTGVLYLADAQARPFPAVDVEAAQVLASLAALAMENDRLYGEVRAAFSAVTATQERLVHTEKARALGEMAGGVAHEFNNILAIILGKTQLMLGRAPADWIREGLGTIEEAAWRAADIVRRLQGYAATALEDTTGSVDMNTLVHDAVTLTRALWKDEAEARGVRIEVVTDLEDVPPVRGNAASLREAVTNLLLNAIDAMPRGGRLGLSTRAREGGVEVTVEDSGEGMSPEVRRRIFEPFFSTRSPLRTGLGLSVVHGIITRHRGRVDLVSEEGRGTRITLWLPGVPAAAGEAGGAAPVREPQVGEVPARASILVIEDEEPIRRMLVDSLTQAGHDVQTAADGLAGLARFQGGRFDVVLTDLSLPERSGLEVARAVKATRPEMPVVLVTGWGHLLDPARLRESGVDLMLVKPFRLERVQSVVAEALRLARPT